MCYILSATSVILSRPNCTKIVGGWGSAPDPAGELTTLPRPPNRLGRGQAPPQTPPLGAYGASILAPSALNLSVPHPTEYTGLRIYECVSRIRIRIRIRYSKIWTQHDLCVERTSRFFYKFSTIVARTSELILHKYTA
jgi:hypothetical protein